MFFSAWSMNLVGPGYSIITPVSACMKSLIERFWRPYQRNLYHNVMECGCMNVFTSWWVSSKTFASSTSMMWSPASIPFRSAGPPGATHFTYWPCSRLCQTKLVVRGTSTALSNNTANLKTIILWALILILYVWTSARCVSSTCNSLSPASANYDQR